MLINTEILLAITKFQQTISGKICSQLIEQCYEHQSRESTAVVI
jgi:hypothetical protein